MDRFRRRLIGRLPAWVALALLAVPAILAYAQTSGLFTLTWSGAEGGGVTTSSGGTFTMDGTIGQPEAGTVGGGAFSLSGGFQGGGVSLPGNYAINQTTGNTPVPCNNLIPNSRCRDCVRGFELPFPIELYGEQFNGGNAGSDGTVELTNDLQVSPSRVLTTNTCLPATGFGPTIFPLWAYLDMSTTTTTTLGIYTTTQGSALNRTFVVEWRACLYNGGTCGGYVNFEVIFHEDKPGTFDIIYGELAGGANDATVGVQSADGQTTQFQCRNGTLAQGVGLNFQRVPSLPNGPTNTRTITRTPTNTNTPAPTNTPNCTPQGYSYSVSTGATVVPAPNLVPGSQCDDCGVAIPLPFPVPLYGTSVSSVTAGSNGALFFGTPNTTFSITCIPNTLATNVLAPYWTDLYTVAGTSGCASYPGGCGIFTTTEGVSPNRIFDIEWHAAYYQPTTRLLGADFEVRLFEGSSTIEVIYGNVQVNSGANDAQLAVGVQQNNTPGNYALVGCDTTGGTAPPVSTGQKYTYTYNISTCPTNTPTVTSTPSNTPPAACGPNSDYAATSSAGVIAPGTSLVGGSQCDDCLVSIPLPFSYSLYGVPFNSVNASSNGNLQFSSGNPAYNNSCLPSSLVSYAILAHWDDLSTAVNSGDGIYTSVSGSAPNRIFNIEWRAVYFNNTSQAAPFEVRLYEGQDKFDIVYGTIAQAGSSATVGVQKGTGPQITQFSCNAGSLTPGLKITFTQTSCLTSTPTGTFTNTRTATPTPTPICPGDWTARAAYLSNIMDNAVASQGGFVYSFGGYDGSAIVANAYKYDPGLNSWSAIAGLPAARQAARAVSDGTYIYIVGGWDSGGAVTNTLYRYDPVGNTYLARASFTQVASAPGVAYLVVGGNGKIYKIGGCIDINCTVTATSEVYDIPTNTWSPIASYPTTIAWLMAVGITSGVNAGKVLAAGGVDSGTTATNKTYVYDPGTNTWNDAAAPDLPDNTRWAAASGMVKTRWVLAGGVLANFSTVTNTAIAYDPSSNSWSVMDPMPLARYRMTGGTVGTAPGSAALYVVGGNSGDFTPTPDNQRFLDICQPTHTPTPATTPVLVVHILFQGIPTPNPVKYITDTVTTTLRLVGGGPDIEYGPVGPDGSGFYTIPVGSLPNGTYIIRAKGHKNLSSGTFSCDTITLTGALFTNKDLGTLRAGDAQSTGPINFNVVNASDFTALKATFGKAYGQPGYCECADFNQTDSVDTTDFSLIKGNFGSAGCPNP